MKRKSFSSKAVFTTTLAILGFIFASLAQSPLVQAAGPITGTVFRDFNGNGTRDPDEIGVPGVTVTAYDSTGAAIDDEINQTPPNDEDDHDIAEVTLVQNFDLALRKTLATGQSATVNPEDLVNFTISIFNQGNTTAQNVTITDYLPAGLSLEDSDWTAGPNNTATITLPGPIAPGDSTSVDITVRVDADASPGTFINTAEISRAEDLNGNTPTDIDSTPDNDPNNDGNIIDDEINQTPPNDEDDHDIAEIEILGPTNIGLNFFRASMLQQGIKLEWQTSFEQNTWGFHILRSSQASLSQAERITDQLIVGQGRGSLGASYSWLDTSAQPNQSYYYWLVEHEIGGATHTFGPFKAESMPSANYSIFLPHIRHP